MLQAQSPLDGPGLIAFSLTSPSLLKQRGDRNPLHLTSHPYAAAGVFEVSGRTLIHLRRRLCVVKPAGGGSFWFSEYEVISTTKGPHGEEVSILTTNQTHTAVENLKPESR